MSDGRRPSILVVDDEPDNLDLLERTLGFDYDVHRAANGDEALRLLEQIGDVAVVITDQRMPGMQGTEVLRRARLKRPDAVRMIVTGYASHEDLIEAINSSNVYRFVTKPWDVDEMLRLVKRAARLYESGGGDVLDEATALPNWSFVRREIEREVARASQSQGSFAVDVIRLDGFERFAAFRGTAAAEAMLVDLADTLRGRLSAMDLVGVHSPGVLVAVCPGGSPAGADVSALQPPGLEPPVIVRRRTARYPSDGTRVEELLAVAGL